MDDGWRLVTDTNIVQWTYHPPLQVYKDHSVNVSSGPTTLDKGPFHQSTKSGVPLGPVVSCSSRTLYRGSSPTSPLEPRPSKPKRTVGGRAGTGQWGFRDEGVDVPLTGAQRYDDIHTSLSYRIHGRWVGRDPFVVRKGRSRSRSRLRSTPVDDSRGAHRPATGAGRNHRRALSEKDDGSRNSRTKGRTSGPGFKIKDKDHKKLKINLGQGFTNRVQPQISAKRLWHLESSRNVRFSMNLNHRSFNDYQKLFTIVKP